MHRRCHDPRAKSYRLYGGRGIQVCARWQDFWNFAEDMGEKPKGWCIDRIDSSGNYEPANCRWASQKTQQRNKSCNKLCQEDVDDIRALRKQGAGRSLLARLYGVTWKTIQGIDRYRRWAPDLEPANDSACRARLSA
jgi:hypothetical protein